MAWDYLIDADLNPFLCSESSLAIVFRCLVMRRSVFPIASAYFRIGMLPGELASPNIKAV